MKSKIRYAVIFPRHVRLALLASHFLQRQRLRQTANLFLTLDFKTICSWAAVFQQEAASGFAEAVTVQAGLQGRELSEIEVEVIPSDPESADEREATLQRLRTEIMTGGGPDVFIACTEGNASGTPGQQPPVPLSLENP